MNIPVQIVSKVQPNPNEMRGAALVGADSIVAVEADEPDVVLALTPTLAVSVFALELELELVWVAVAVAVAVTLGATNVPLPVALAEDEVELVLRVPKPTAPLSKSKTEYTFFRKTSPTSQSFSPEDWWLTMVETQPSALRDPM